MARTPSSGQTASGAIPKPQRRRRPGASPARRAQRQGKRRSPYHHGDLHDALLKAAERVLERDGLAGLTLRAVAREAGVSHAAPTHHFGDLTGLVSELAAIGFRQFNAAMVAAGDSETQPLMKGLASAKAYVAYAQAHPGMYGLMFRTERLDHSRPALHEAAEARVRRTGRRRRRQPAGADSEEALSLDSRRHRARLVAGAWFYHAAA